MCKAGRVGFDDVIKDDIESEFSSRGWLMQQIWFRPVIKDLLFGMLEQWQPALVILFIKPMLGIK